MLTCIYSTLYNEYSLLKIKHHPYISIHAHQYSRATYSILYVCMYVYSDSDSPFTHISGFFLASDINARTTHCHPERFSTKYIRNDCTDIFPLISRLSSDSCYTERRIHSIPSENTKKHHSIIHISISIHFRRFLIGNSIDRSTFSITVTINCGQIAENSFEYS